MFPSVRLRLFFLEFVKPSSSSKPTSEGLKNREPTIRTALVRSVASVNATCDEGPLPIDRSAATIGEDASGPVRSSRLRTSSASSTPCRIWTQTIMGSPPRQAQNLASWWPLGLLLRTNVLSFGSFEATQSKSSEATPPEKSTVIESKSELWADALSTVASEKRLVFMALSRCSTYHLPTMEWAT